MGSKSLKEKIKGLSFFYKLIFSLLFCITIYYSITYAIEYTKYKLTLELSKGRNHSDLDYIETLRIFDSLDKGLNYFYHINGHYPNIESKYFIDSIKYFLGDLTPYVYSDSIDINSKVIPKNTSLNRNKYLVTDRCFVGIGLRENYIMYRKLKNNSKFKLYCIGQNWLDEIGKGDDLNYSK